VTPTAVAGVVSFEISNPTDGYHGVQINRMLPGVTIEEVRADALELARTGAESSNLEEDPLLGVVNGPHDHFVTAIPLEAGEYAVLLTTTDESFAGAPDADGHGVRQLTITTGSAGSAPTPTLTFDRIAEDGSHHRAAGSGDDPRRQHRCGLVPVLARGAPRRRDAARFRAVGAEQRGARRLRLEHLTSRHRPGVLRRCRSANRHRRPRRRRPPCRRPTRRLIKAVPSPSSGSPSTDSGKHPPHAARSRR
jgi:hypothetical protein